VAGRAAGPPGRGCEVDVLVVALFAMTAVAASAPIVAAVLVSVASRREDSEWTLGAPAPGPGSGSRKAHRGLPLRGRLALEFSKFSSKQTG